MEHINLPEAGLQSPVLSTSSLKVPHKEEGINYMSLSLRIAREAEGMS